MLGKITRQTRCLNSQFRFNPTSSGSTPPTGGASWGQNRATARPALERKNRTCVSICKAHLPSTHEISSFVPVSVVRSTSTIREEHILLMRSTSTTLARADQWVAPRLPANGDCPATGSSGRRGCPEAPSSNSQAPTPGRNTAIVGR
jgi:hypothetical protein